MEILLPGEFGAVGDAALEGILFLKTVSKSEKLGAKMVDAPDHADDVDDEANIPDSDEEIIQKKFNRSSGYSLGDSE